LLDGIVDRGAHGTANRIHLYVRRFFKWCVGRNVIAIDPTTNLQKPAKLSSRDRVLTDEELAKVWQASEDSPYGVIHKLLALTGLRRDQIGRLRWSEIQGDTIHLEGERTKTGNPHLVPLSKAAQAILRDWQSRRRISEEYVFSLDGVRAVNSWARGKAKLDKDSGVTNWVTHDLRRTVATGMQRLGITEQVVEAVLGHVQGRRAGIVRVYQKHDYAAEKREAVERWGEYIMGLVGQ
jgi:integrase